MSTSSDHRRQAMNHLRFVPPAPALYSADAHFGDVGERRDYMTIGDSTAMPNTATSHTGLSYSQGFDYNNYHVDWSNTFDVNSQAHFQPRNEFPFVHYSPSSSSNGFHGSYDFPKYDLYDQHLVQELLPPNPVSVTLDSSMIHPSRSAPPSCSSSPQVPDTFVDFLEVTMATGKSSISREHSPAQSEVDTGDARRRYPCLMEGCPRRFTSQYTLRVHMDAHKPKPKVTFPCTLGCSETFSRQHDRLRHEVSKHGKICEFLCSHCGRFFSTRKTLGNHKCPVAHGTTRWMDN
ncbi:hypothetical protein APHAL10511_003116 [Amanita phalloides]|nr:hypothetical protein APHAL10511_003116 [Amanita phalloides]